jgi:membrane dipeptidase
LRSVAHAGVILELSHMADQAVTDAAEGWKGPGLASHGDTRALVSGRRQLADEAVTEDLDGGFGAEAPIVERERIGCGEC